MNLTFTPFASMKLVAITVAEPDTGAPRHVRVVDAAVAHEVRRQALSPRSTESPADDTGTHSSSLERSDAGPRRDATDRDADRLDALIRRAEGSSHPGRHECGGA